MSTRDRNCQNIAQQMHEMPEVRELTYKSSWSQCGQSFNLTQQNNSENIEQTGLREATLNAQNNRDGVKTMQ